MAQVRDVCSGDSAIKQAHDPMLLFFSFPLSSDCYPFLTIQVFKGLHLLLYFHRPHLQFYPSDLVSLVSSFPLLPLCNYVPSPLPVVWLHCTAPPSPGKTNFQVFFFHFDKAMKRREGNSCRLQSGGQRDKKRPVTKRQWEVSLEGGAERHTLQLMTLALK